MSEDRHPLVEKILAGEAPQLLRLAAEGTLPLPQEVLVPLQIRLAKSIDPQISGRATRSLAELPAESLAKIVEHHVPPEILIHLADLSEDETVLEAILRRRDGPAEVIVGLARKVSPRLQEIVLLRQDAILAEPFILEALEGNPRLSTYSRRRIDEYREHLLPRDGPRQAPVAEPEPRDEDVTAAIEEARRQPAVGERDQQTGLSDAQIRALPVPIRCKLARGASRSLRHILVRDNNPQVAVSAIADGGLSEGEIEQIAANRSVVGEVLEEICRHRAWVSKQKILEALVHNPRTPAGVAVRLMPRLSVRELGLLAKDRNVAHAVRTTADRLYRMKRR